jgi:hypothetical protein
VRTRTRLHTLEDLIDFFQVDLNVWEVESWTANKWEVGHAPRAMGGDVANYGGWHREDATFKIEPLYQVKARFRKKRKVLAARAEIAALLEDAKQQAPYYAPLLRMPAASDLLLEISLFDAHFGKRSWPEETGADPYDLDIAEREYGEALEQLIERTRHHTFREILFPVGNDGINSEADGDTTAGTRQDNDGRHIKVFRAFRRSVTRAIDRLRQVAPVVVKTVPGNHDRNAILYLGELLSVQYENTPDVTLDTSPMLAKYHEFGRNMLLFTHGSEERHEDLPLMMATDQSEMWGRTIFREAHVGHLHHTRMNVKAVGEKMGVRVRILPSLCPTDAWSRMRGYVNSLRGGEAFVWDGRHGLVENQHFTILPAKYSQ